MDYPAASNPVEILLVEDNPGDARLAAEALKETRMLHRLTLARDGLEAMALLRRQGPYAQSIRPDLILLDLNLPWKDGFEVLAEIKEDGGLKRIPVVILTTSDAERDILRAYELHGNCYVRKPSHLEDFIEVVKSIESFWFTIVKLPSERRADD